MDALSALFRAGGPLMWPIALVSLLAWAVACREWLRLDTLRRPLAAAVALLSASDHEALPRQPTGALGPLCTAELVRADGSLSRLSALVHVLPLLGLLGTVTGMLSTFDVLRVHGAGVRPLGDGIREALITTQTGLSLALPLQLLHRHLASRLQRISGEHALLLHALRSDGGPRGLDAAALCTRLGFGSPTALLPLQVRIVAAMSGRAR